jgi:cytochrome c oxidase assembly protein subunit 15
MKPEISPLSLKENKRPNFARTLRRFAVLSVVATYLLIFAGGLVRVSGAGMGCPDWPKCYGMWIPPTHVSELKPPYDPAAFNPTLTWIEYINRLMGVLVGLIILATSVYAAIRFLRTPKLFLPAFAATVLVAFQGWLGKVVVKTDLNPFVVTLHLSLALIIVSVLIYLVLQAYAEECGQKEEKPLKTPLTGYAAGLWLFEMMQLVLGTQVREKLEWLSKNFPLFTEAEWLAEVGWIGKLHGLTGVLLAVLTWVVGYKLLTEHKAASGITRSCMLTMMGLSLAEVVVGLSLVWVGIPAVMQIFHQWIASLYIGTAFALVTWLHARGVAEAAGAYLQHQTAVAN